MADIVLVHGLWNRGWSMAPMAARLRARGHRVMVFSYPTRSQTVRQHADDLHRFIEQLPDGHYHLAGHSMGGLVILDMLSRFHTPMLRRVVLMGTPLRGSALVERLEKMPGQKLMFGKARESLRKGFQQIPANHETGMIRGTKAFGLGRMAGSHGEPSDGSVAVSETEINGLADRVELPVAHSGMLVSLEVVEQLEHFLLHGRFRHAAA